MNKLFAAALVFAALLPATAAEADVPGLQVNPLQYEDTLTTDTVKLGYIEVSNPSDTTITLQSSVQGFRQKDNAGRLSFFDDPQISDGIKVDLAKFDLGSREAIRVAFSVDPTKLPKGGVYAVIFFRTIPPAHSANTSYVAESANIGTLLLLQNGGSGVHVGQITRLTLPFWQFGGGISGTVDYSNTDRSTTAVGFRPALTAQVFPWGSAPRLATGLVLPSSERQFAVNRPGSFFGLLPLTLTDAQSHKYTTAWVFAVTGWYQLLLLILLITAVFLWAVSRFTGFSLIKITMAHLERTQVLLRSFKLPWQRRPVRIKRSLDTISRKPADMPVAPPVPEITSEPEPESDSQLDSELNPAPETAPAPIPPESPKPIAKAKTTPKTGPKRKRKPKPKTE